MAREVSSEVLSHLARVVFGTVDEGGLASAEDRQTQCVQPGRIADDSAVVAQLSLVVDDGDVKPAVVGTESRCPDHRANLSAGEIEMQARLVRSACRLEALGRADVEVTGAVAM